MSKQNYVRLKVELTVNGVTCPISEEFMDHILRDSNHSRHHFYNTAPKKQLSDDVVCEIAKSRQLTQRQFVARYTYITREILSDFLSNFDFNILRTLTYNKTALAIMTGDELCALAGHNDVVIARIIASQITEAVLRPKIKETPAIISLLLAQQDTEIRCLLAGYIAEQVVGAEQFHHLIDDDTLQLVNARVEKRRDSLQSK
ncbi:MAG: hypothetical protein IPM69_11905 [Ignavibacteria bacterium]|nr:hypothetical protein [Ignavibacteria bacterium]